jgi:hypothetical protein
MAKTMYKEKIHVLWKIMFIGVFMKKQFVSLHLVSIIGIILLFNCVFSGCDNETTSDSNPNELGGKTVYLSPGNVASIYEFFEDGTYIYYYGTEKNDDSEEQNGNYSWESTTTPKTVTFIPKNAKFFADHPVDKNTAINELKSYLDDPANESKKTEWFQGYGVTTVDDLIDAAIEESYSSYIYEYSIDGGNIIIYKN